MEKKKLVCNDCGCRFEVKDVKAHAAEERKPEPGKKEQGPGRPSCPECRSYNVTTA